MKPPGRWSREWDMVVTMLKKVATINTTIVFYGEAKLLITASEKVELPHGKISSSVNSYVILEDILN